MASFFNKLNIILRRSNWTILFVLIVGLTIYLFMNGRISLEVFAAALGTTITAYLGILKQSRDDDEVFRELFTTFNSRYSNKTNDLLNKLRLEEVTVLTLDEKYLIIDYFNLCSEEYLWYLKGRIPSNVWKAWLAGIEVNLSIPSVYELFKNETSSKDKSSSYYGFAEFILKRLPK